MCTLIHANRDEIKQLLLDYCFDYFEEENIWLVDSFQIFSPYYWSRIDTERTRFLLKRLRVSRPFNMYQLNEKMFSFTKIPLTSKDTIIISSLDCFFDEIKGKERGALFRGLSLLLAQLQQISGCKVIIGLYEKEVIDILQDYNEVSAWGGLSNQSDTRLRPSWMSSGDLSRHCEKKIEYTLNSYM